MLSIKKISSGLLSLILLILLISTFGVSVNRHYCLGMLVDESYFVPTAGCPSMEEDACFSTEINCHNNCCDDEQILIPGLEVQQQLQDKFAFAGTFIISEPAYTNVQPGLFQIADDSIKLLPRPPSLRTSGRTILIDVQRFII